MFPNFVARCLLWAGLHSSPPSAAQRWTVALEAFISLLVSGETITGVPTPSICSLLSFMQSSLPARHFVLLDGHLYSRKALWVARGCWLMMPACLLFIISFPLFCSQKADVVIGTRYTLPETIDVLSESMLYLSQYKCYWTQRRCYLAQNMSYLTHVMLNVFPENYTLFDAMHVLLYMTLELLDINMC